MQHAKNAKIAGTAHLAPEKKEEFVNMPSMVIVVVLALVVSPVLVLDAGASEEARKAQGMTTFLENCAVCHGATGVGDGPFAEELRTAPADLTRIAERRDGVFPAAQMVEIVDGRRRVRGHGPRTMPIWGKKFGPDVAAGSANRAVAQDAILRLVEYLRTLQRVPAAE